ncbi:MAG: MarR family winged helix-turn-helix transcriptional regulator [Bacteroidales bacterium]|nr:MarR family winged helix-turn-helix transcriptional regulator [Bacteroidales bacterium]
MMDGVKVVELVCLYHQFYSESGSDELKKFSAWMNKNASLNPLEEKTVSEKDLNVYLLNLVSRISKFQRLYTKHFFQDFKVKSMEEYNFLLTIDKLDSPSKSDVYAQNVIELTTGTKIIKRLIDLDFVKEAEDKLDKRVKRLKLSAKGKKEMADIQKRLHNIDDEKLGYISLEDKNLLLEILNNINQYHTEIYERNPDSYGKGNYDVF